MMAKNHLTTQLFVCINYFYIYRSSTTIIITDNGNEEKVKFRIEWPK